jgi:hypothetical protein
MNLLPIVKRILLENDIQVDDLSQDTEISERGYEFLKEKIDKLNAKAAKWHVPPLELGVVREREVPVTKRDMWGNEENVGVKKLYTIQIKGVTPRVEGYVFIGKVQHTTGGENILNIAPGSPIKNLPDIYRTAKAECDVCKEKRERFNTFILQLEQEDLQRFPDKKAHDLIQVGSACLHRFLPGISVDQLMNYAKLIEELRAFRDGSGGEEWDDDSDYDAERGGPNPFRRHVNTETLLKYIALTYMARGEYVSKSKGGYDKFPTAEEASSVMFDTKHQTWINDQARKNPAIRNGANDLAAKVIHWMKKMDFNELGRNSPEWANYFGNLNVVAHSSSMDIKNANYLGGVFQTYLRMEQEKEKSAAAQGKGYVGTVGQRIAFNGTLRVKRPLPVSHWGQSYLYVFEDMDKNNIKWITNKDMGFEVGQTYSMSGKVKVHEVDKWTKQPTTVITHGKIETM